MSYKIEFQILKKLLLHMTEFVKIFHVCYFIHRRKKRKKNKDRYLSYMKKNI